MTKYLYAAAALDALVYITLGCLAYHYFTCPLAWC